MGWQCIGSGMDKEFYIEESGNGGYGAICCSDEVAARETKAYIDLKTIGIGDVLPVILPWTRKTGVDGAGKKPQYEIQRIALGRTFKPLMCAMAVLGPVKKELGRGDPAKIRAGLDLIEANLKSICGIVGELTLAVDGLSKGIFMLDFAPGHGNATAVSQLSKISEGMANIRAAVS